MKEHAVNTPTLELLRATKRASAARPYVFRLTDDQVDIARTHKLPDSCLIALAAITASAYGDRSGQWVTLPARTVDCIGRGFRWWHRATAKLEQAGLIECQRHVGRLPRYRLARHGET